jgi:cytochrome P450
MSFRKHTVMAFSLAACLGISVLTQDARACGGEWYPEVMIDPRIHGVAQAEKALANGNRLAAAASVIRMIPHIKTLKSKPGSLVARAERVLAVALSRSQGALPVAKEVPSEVLGSWQGSKASDSAANLAWSVEVLKRQSDSKDDDVSLKTDLAEAMARLPEQRAEARSILEDLAKRDLIASPEGYAALASLRSQSGDTDGQKLALKRCEAMAKSQDACTVRS